MKSLRAAFSTLLACAAMGSPALSGIAHAQENAGQTLVLELNGAQKSDKGCRLTFLVTNNLGAELTKAAFEIALFNDQGVVDRLTVLDFSDLPASKTKVSRFDLSGVDCAKISRVLVNTSTACEGAGVDPKACLTKLEPKTKSEIVFGV